MQLLHSLRNFNFSRKIATETFVLQLQISNDSYIFIVAIFTIHYNEDADWLNNYENLFETFEISLIGFLGWYLILILLLL